MDAEDLPATGLRNGLRAVVSSASTLHVTHFPTRAAGCVSGTEALDEDPPTSSTLLRCRAI